MLKKFNEECNKILKDTKITFESVGFSDADELLEEIFDKNSFNNFNEFKKDLNLIKRIKSTNKDIIENAAKGIWEDTIEKLDPEDENDEDQYTFAKQLYYFLKETI